MNAVTRRKSMCLLMGCGGAALGAAGASWAWDERAKGHAVTRTSWALGTNVSLTTAGLNRSRAERALDAAFAELELVESVMSLYRPESEICQLNREGVLDKPHPHLVAVLREAERTSRRTGGAFDITVQPLWEVFSTAKKDGRLPDEAAVAAARERVDWRRVSVAAERVRLAGGTQITLNGIAQGFAADRVRAVLESHGVQHALLNTGELATIGLKPSADPWTVGIQHPRQSDAYVAVAGLSGRAMATSGDYETTFSTDFRQHHVFDPRSGHSPTELASVTIVAPTAIQADALSTAAMVLGTRQTIALVSELPDVDVLLVTKQGRSLSSPGFPELAV